MPNYTFECKVCGEVFDELMPINVEHKIKHCGKNAQRVWVFNTPKDKLFEFMAMNTDTPTEIRTKKGWEKYLKFNGLYHFTKDEERSLRPKFKETAKKIAREKALETCNKLHSQGVFQRMRDNKKYYMGLSRERKISIQRKAMEVGGHAYR